MNSSFKKVQNPPPKKLSQIRKTVTIKIMGNNLEEYFGGTEKLDIHKLELKGEYG